MIIEAGRYYKTRDGRKVGPIEWVNKPFTSIPDKGYWTAKDGSWYENGYHTSAKGDHYHSLDLISEWVEAGPVREVTRREIVPGDYGIINVGNAGYGGRVAIAFGKDGHRPYNASELRIAAAVLLELSAALGE